MRSYLGSIQTLTMELWELCTQDITHSVLTPSAWCSLVSSQRLRHFPYPPAHILYSHTCNLLGIVILTVHPIQVTD